MSGFLREDHEYVRGVNVIKGYMKQTGHYLHRMTDKDPELVKSWLKKEFSKGGRFELKPPMANITVRDKETGDRRAARINMAKLFQVMEKNELICSPSMTFYVPAKYKRSLLSEFIDENIQKRAKVKKEMFAAQAAGDDLLAANKKNEQNSFKQRNNALSGAHSSPYTILYNKSTHSSLTSMCRSATSYGNANNEKLLAGSRHYWAPGIVINNILSISTLTDMDAFKKCVDFYNLHIPTPEEVMSCIRYSSDLFWRNGRALDKIRELVDKLTDLERAAFVYIGDLYHLAMYNDSVVRGFLTRMVEKECDLSVAVEEMEKRLDGDTIALVSLLRSDLMAGYKNFKKAKENDMDAYKNLLGACEHIYSVVEEYDLLIKEIMTTRNVPASIARLPDTIRRVSLVSDTDSTMATAQWWSAWMCDGEMTGKAADDVADTIIYIATQNIAHMMARMSTNIGVEKKYLHRYAMKNEFKFSSFALTNKAKHYFSLITSQEGTLKKEPELEVKGVALRTSNIPPLIMDEFRKNIIAFSTDVMEGRNIKIMPLLNRVADIEHEVMDSVRAGHSDYLKTGNVKTKTAYSEPEKSNYVYYGWWEEIFAPKYGTAGEPTYNVVKISVDLGNKTLIRRWLDKMEDQELANRFRAWMAKYPNRKFTQFLLPETVMVTSGIPKEILDVADYRRIAFNSVEPYYHVLESLGFLMIDKNRTRLVSDYYGQANVAKAKAEIGYVEEKEAA